MSSQKEIKGAEEEKKGKEEDKEKKEEKKDTVHQEQKREAIERKKYVMCCDTVYLLWTQEAARFEVAEVWSSATDAMISERTFRTNHPNRFTWIQLVTLNHIPYYSEQHAHECKWERSSRYKYIQAPVECFLIFKTHDPWPILDSVLESEANATDRVLECQRHVDRDDLSIYYKKRFPILLT